MRSKDTVCLFVCICPNCQLTYVGSYASANITSGVFCRRATYEDDCEYFVPLASLMF